VFLKWFLMCFWCDLDVFLMWFCSGKIIMRSVMFSSFYHFINRIFVRKSMRIGWAMLWFNPHLFTHWHWKWIIFLKIFIVIWIITSEMAISRVVLSREWFCLYVLWFIMCFHDLWCVFMIYDVFLWSVFHDAWSDLGLFIDVFGDAWPTNTS